MEANPDRVVVKCIECLQFVTANSINDIDIGDHIIFCGTIYNHHGIVTDKDENGITVAEATNTVLGFSLGTTFWTGKVVLKETRKEIDFTKTKIQIVVYRDPRYEKRQIANRAQKFCREKDKDGTYRYNVVSNNCEHFATECVTGNPFSFQIGKARTVVGAYWKKGFQGICDETDRNYFLFESNHICRRCYVDNLFVLSVNFRPVLCTEDIQKGDIIRFSYWYFPHDGVVLDTRVEGWQIECDVAHYVWPGIWKHRKIIEETITIPLDGSVSVLQYVPPKYDVYPADVVVTRAKSRIGEEKFVSFSHDSSHFSRWCKLRRMEPMQDATKKDAPESPDDGKK